MPTPGVAYLTRALRSQAGIVISASHNPFEDNGIKFFSASGSKLPDETELAIEAELEQPMRTMPSAQLGKAKRIDDAAGRYIEFCKSTFPNELDLRGMKIVVDCAHGATYHVAPPVFHELGAEVVAFGNQPDGLNINLNCGATKPQLLQQAVKEHQADLGIALDGDGDRLMMADASGQLYDGDQLLYVIAKYRHEQGLLKGGVVGTLMTNLAMEHALAKLGIPFARAKVGDRYVLEMMQEKGWQLGGENSGHIALSRQAHHRRWHHFCPAGAACAQGKRKIAGQLYAGTGVISADSDQCAGRQRFRFPRQHRGSGCSGASGAALWMARAACCCGLPARNPCCG